MGHSGKAGGLTRSLRVQYLYQLAGLPRMSFSQANPNPVATPSIPLNAIAPLAALVWFYNNNTNAYQLQEYRAAMLITIPTNITIDKISLKVFSGPIYTSKTTTLSVPSTPEYLQPNALKIYASDVATQIPYTYAPLAADFLSDPIIQKPAVSGSDVTTAVLGSSSWNPTDGAAIQSIDGDLTALFQPGDHKMIEFREATGSSTNASGGTLFAYAILEGYVAEA